MPAGRQEPRDSLSMRLAIGGFQLADAELAPEGIPPTAKMPLPATVRLSAGRSPLLLSDHWNRTSVSTAGNDLWLESSADLSPNYSPPVRDCLNLFIRLA